MIKFCTHCGKPFQTDYPSKLYCNKNCAKKAALNRDESFYEFPHDVNQPPIYEFECAWCGKTVKVYSNYDQRNRFCCGSGAVVINSLNALLAAGINPSAQCVVTASDLDERCVFMTFIQLSLYGIPATVLIKNAVTDEQFGAAWNTFQYKKIALEKDTI